MPLRIFQLKTLAGANAVGFLLGGSFFAFIFIGTLYMQQVLGYSALKAGLAWLAAWPIFVDYHMVALSFARCPGAPYCGHLARVVAFSRRVRTSLARS